MTFHEPSKSLLGLEDSGRRPLRTLREPWGEGAGISRLWGFQALLLHLHPGRGCPWPLVSKAVDREPALKVLHVLQCDLKSLLIVAGDLILTGTSSRGDSLWTHSRGAQRKQRVGWGSFTEPGFSSVFPGIPAGLKALVFSLNLLSCPFLRKVTESTPGCWCMSWRVSGDERACLMSAEPGTTSACH